MIKAKIQKNGNSNKYYKNKRTKARKPSSCKCKESLIHYRVDSFYDNNKFKFNSRHFLSNQRMNNYIFVKETSGKPIKKRVVKPLSKDFTFKKYIIESGIRCIEDIFLTSFYFFNYKVVNILFGKSLYVKIVKIDTVARQTRSGRKFKKKIAVVVGDKKGHLGLGIKSSREFVAAKDSATKIAKKNLIRIRKGFWYANENQPNTVKYRVSGKCGSVIVVIAPAPIGTGIKAAKFQRNVISPSGVSDCYTYCFGHTKTSFNTIKATFNALRNTYKFLTPDLWPYSN